jgi:hypothetical protein
MTSNAEKSDGSAVPLPDDLLRHRVDDERHVVGHDVDDGLRRTEPVLLEIRGVHPHRGCTRRSIEREDQVRHRGAVPVVHVPGREVAARDVPAVLPDEHLEEPLLLRGQPLLGVPPDLVDDLGSVAGRDGGHGNPLRPRHSALLGGVRQGAADRYPRRAHAAGGVAPATARVQLAGNPSASPAARWARWVSWPEKMKLGYVPTRRSDTATLVFLPVRSPRCLTDEASKALVVPAGCFAPPISPRAVPVQRSRWPRAAARPWRGADRGRGPAEEPAELGAVHACISGGGPLTGSGPWTGRSGLAESRLSLTASPSADLRIVNT